MRPIRQCINSKLTQICLQAIQLEELSITIGQFLPIELRPHCQVTRFQAGQLVLTTTSAVWASQLRYVIPELRDRLRAELKWSLVSIQVKLQTSVGQP